MDNTPRLVLASSTALCRCILLSCLVLSGCSTLPPRPQITNTDINLSDLEQSEQSEFFSDHQTNLLYPLVDPLEAYAVRVQLIRQAQDSIDLAYYIWGNDLTGQLMLHELQAAAQRGVHVRLLLDDNNTKGLDALLLALDEHPNIEIRLFNPVRFRQMRTINYLVDLQRVQRRMHGKILTVDQETSIVGGRNIADPYYRVTPNLFFADLDILSAGETAAAAEAHFERFWQDQLSYPVQGFLKASTNARLHALQKINSAYQHDRAQPYVQAVEKNDTLERLIHRENTQTVANAEAKLSSAPTVFVSDWPMKTHKAIPFAQTIGAQMYALSGQAQRQLSMISPYFVPQAEGTAQLIKLAKKGVTVNILTNSLAATDVPALHQFYARYRQQLACSGVHVYEFKPTADTRQIKIWRVRERFGRKSHGSLHAKALTWDGELSFIGSMNIDPRSVMLNTELGVMVRSPDIAQQIEQVFSRNVLQLAYRVSCNAAGRLSWTEQTSDGKTVTYATEPAPLIRKGLSHVVGWLPIEHLM